MRLCSIQTGRKDRDDAVDSQTSKLRHFVTETEISEI